MPTLVWSLSREQLIGNETKQQQKHYKDEPVTTWFGWLD